MPLPWRYAAPLDEAGHSRRIPKRGRHLVSVVAAVLLVAVVFKVIIDANSMGATIRTPDAFYGYYTVDFEKGIKLVGMLSVNRTAAMSGSTPGTAASSSPRT